MNSSTRKDRQAAESSKKAIATTKMDYFFGMLVVLAVVVFLATHNLLHESVEPSTSANNVKADLLKDFAAARPSNLKKSMPNPPQAVAHNETGKGSSPLDRDVYVVFSTSCSDQMHWESYVFFYYAFKVKQPGSVTRICSGCSTDEAAKLQDFHAKYIQPMNPNFYLQLTPNFAQRETADGKRVNYKYMNKPFGLQYWLENTVLPQKGKIQSQIDNGVVVLMDPDMILHRPITGDFSNEEALFVEDNPSTRRVEHGKPMSQQDGYLNNVWMSLNVSYITNGTTQSLGSDLNVHPGDGPKHWNTGPPYLATVKDMHAIATLWKVYAPRVHDIHPHLFAEMYGYIFATAQLGLPHTLIKSLVVSEPPSPRREGWSYIDALPEKDICKYTPIDLHFEKGYPMPFGIHYCKRYGVDRFFFSKYRLKKKYIEDCSLPLLTPPPADLAQQGHLHFWGPPPHGHRGPYESQKVAMSAKEAKRMAFMVCGLIDAVNEAAIHYKTQACPAGTGNFSTVYNFHDDPDH